VTIAWANPITVRLRPNPVLVLGGDHLDVLGTDFDDVNSAVLPNTACVSTFCWNDERSALAAPSSRRKTNEQRTTSMGIRRSGWTKVAASWRAKRPKDRVRTLEGPYT
jgi:hypothetical protein